jgi:anthranilate phosphoribosyltransferase
MSDLSKFVHAMGRGPSKGRNLTRAEAADAMAHILSGKAAPEAVGALFMLMRYRGEKPAEIAGFVDALRSTTEEWSSLDIALDWPSYAAGRTRGAPLFLLSAMLVAQAGYPVMIHGWNSHQRSVASVQAGVGELGLPVCRTVAEARDALGQGSLIYCPLEAISPIALDLLKLRDVLGLRSPVNTALRTWNPSQAGATVQGVFHPAYRILQTEASRLLEQPQFTVIKGGGGEFERNPSKDIDLFLLQNGAPQRLVATATMSDPQRLSDATTVTGDLTALWRGTAQNEFAERTVTGTAAVALLALGATEKLDDAQVLAERLWDERPVLCSKELEATS